MLENTSNLHEFRVYGTSIEKFSVFYGIFLVCFGVFVSFASNSESITSFIPSLLGLPIILFSLLAIKFEYKKKIFMHIVVIFGILIFLGGLDLVRSILNQNIFQNFWPDISKLVMLLSSLIFNIQCIKSFMHARKNEV